MNLPPHHANAPTPRTEHLVKALHSNVLEVSSGAGSLLQHCCQLEREQQYMMEVLEKAMLALADCKATIAIETPYHWTIEQADEIRTAYNNLKAYMEQKK